MNHARPWRHLALLGALILVGCRAPGSGEQVLVRQADGSVIKARVISARGDILILRRDDDKRLRVGGHAPDFTATDVAGQQHKLSAYKGHVVVLHFWASWCPFCRKSIPKMMEIQQQYASRGLQILAVSTDKDLETLKQFLAQNPLPYPVMHAREVAEQYQLDGIPLTFVIDQHGVIRHRQEGYGEEFMTVVKQLMGS